MFDSKIFDQKFLLESVAKEQIFYNRFYATIDISLHQISLF